MKKDEKIPGVEKEKRHGELHNTSVSFDRDVPYHRVHREARRRNLAARVNAEPLKSTIMGNRFSKHPKEHHRGNDVG